MKRTKRKAFGQHFLRDRKALSRIIRLIDPRPEDIIVEIGAGTGALTFPLASKAGKVIAIEKDWSLIPLLKKKPLENLVILEGDILKISFQEVLDKHSGVKLVGNLPYSISTPILFKVAAQKAFFSVCLFLVQKEVAERLTAPPGRKAYAPLSIYFQNYFLTRLHFTLTPASFSPPPKVDSAFISLKKRETPLHAIADEREYLLFLRTVFRHRRKTLFNNLVLAGIPPSQIEDIFKICQIEKHLRPEQVTPEQFFSLHKELSLVPSDSSD